MVIGTIIIVGLIAAALFSAGCMVFTAICFINSQI